jgi:hypothetical protein
VYERILGAIFGGCKTGRSPWIPARWLLLFQKLMAPALPKVFELRDEDKDWWYRVLYVKLEGVVYVLHCFTKKTNETPQKEINTAQGRLTALKQRLAALTKTKRRST